MNTTDMFLRVEYTQNGKKFVANEKSDSLAFDVSACGLGKVIKLNGDFSKAVISSVELKVPVAINSEYKAFVNGYQSWTPAREYSYNEIETDMSNLAKALNFHYKFTSYGDYSFYKYKKTAGFFHSYTYTYIRKDENFKLFGSINERTGFTVFEIDYLNSMVTIKKQVDGLNVDGNIELLNFCILNGREEEVFDEYFNIMGIAKPTAKKMIGFTSWYNYYQNIDEEILSRCLTNFENLPKKIDIFQIDDGYATHVGDWLSIDMVKFPNGVQPIFDRVRKNFKLGLWLAPFVAEKKSDIFKNHKDWILRDDNGKMVCAGCNWSGFYALDIYNKEVREYLKKVFDTVFNVWKVDLVKLDFLYAVCLAKRKNKTRAEVMFDAMEFLRELCVGKEILGCGVPLAPCFGKVEYMRIGPDVSLDYDDTKIMQKIQRERPSTKTAVINAIGRRHLDGRAFLNDPDVFFIRNDNIKMPHNEKMLLARVNGLLGSVVFTSDDLSKFHNTEMIKDLVGIFELTSAKVSNVTVESYEKVIISYTKNGASFRLLINLSDEAVYFDKIIVPPHSSEIA